MAPNEFSSSEQESAYNDLLRTREVPMNRKQRRTLAKRAGVSFVAVNQGMAKRYPIYLGIKRFKSIVGNEKTEHIENPTALKEQYKSNAWQSKKELENHRALEAAKLARIINPKEKHDAHRSRRNADT